MDLATYQFMHALLSSTKIIPMYQHANLVAEILFYVLRYWANFGTFDY